MSRNGQVKCHCLPGYAGPYCQDTGRYNRNEVFATFKLIVYKSASKYRSFRGLKDSYLRYAFLFSRFLLLLMLCFL